MSPTSFFSCLYLVFILFYSVPATIFSLAFFHLFVHFNSGPCQCISYWAEHTWSPLIPKSLLCASSSHHSVVERGSSVMLRRLPPGHWRCGGSCKKTTIRMSRKGFFPPLYTHTMECPSRWSSCLRASHWFLSAPAPSVFSAPLFPLSYKFLLSFQPCKTKPSGSPLPTASYQGIIPYTIPSLGKTPVPGEHFQPAVCEANSL